MKVTPTGLSFSKANRTPQSVTVTELLSGSWTAKGTSGILVSPSEGPNDSAFTVSWVPQHAADGSIEVKAPGQPAIKIPVVFTK